MALEISFLISAIFNPEDAQEDLFCANEDVIDIAKAAPPTAAGDIDILLTNEFFFLLVLGYLYYFNNA